MEAYSCKACGAPAAVDERGITRSCGCNTTVVADMNATVYGEGHTFVLTPAQRILAFFHSVGLDFMAKARGRV